MTSTIPTAWNQILAWLLANDPDGVKVCPPASSENIVAAAARIGISFPAELTEFYHQLNGAESCAVFPSPATYEMAMTPISLDEAVAEWEGQRDNFTIGEFRDCIPESDNGVADDWWNLGWIPFASDGGGDFLCVDTSPTSAGTVGQVITHSHESGKHKLLARSLSDYLTQLAKRMAESHFVVDEKYGVVLRDVIDTGSDTEMPADRETSMSEWHFARALEVAEKAFKDKDYAKVVARLERFSDRLEKLPATRLAFAKKNVAFER